MGDTLAMSSQCMICSSKINIFIPTVQIVLTMFLVSVNSILYNVSYKQNLHMPGQSNNILESPYRGIILPLSFQSSGSILCLRMYFSNITNPESIPQPTSLVGFLLSGPRYYTFLNYLRAQITRNRPYALQSTEII